jgi:glycogen operon protein
MLVAGDELGRTQKGNNNAYCQDNRISWLDWKGADARLFDFTRKLISFYKAHPVFSRRRWFKGRPIKGVGVEDIAWFLPDGTEMSEENWTNDFAKSLAVYFNGRGLRSLGSKGEMILDDNFYLIFNAYHGPIDYTIPVARYGGNWVKVLDTAAELISDEAMPSAELAEDVITIEGNSVVVLKQPRFL